MTNWKYTDPSNSVVARTLDDGRCESCQVEAISDWLAKGNTPEPADPVPVPPVTNITKLSFVEWCEANNKLDALIALLASDAILKFKWDAATSLAIDNPLVIGAAAALGIADPQAVFNEIGQ